MAPQVLSLLLVVLVLACANLRPVSFVAPGGTNVPLAVGSRSSSSLHFKPVTSGTSCSPAAVLLGLTSLVAAQCRRGRPHGSRHVQCRATVAQWNKRVKRIEGGRAVFDVTLLKPLGLTPKNFPNRPGVGIAKIKEGGNTEFWNKKVLLEDVPGMFVLEGDEVVGVNDTICEGKDLETVSKLVKESPGDTVTLKLVRNYLTGPVKIVWKPSLKMGTYKRGALLRACEETLGANVRYSCEDGWCSSCWHAEDNYMTVYRICKMDVPEKWDNVMPFVLLSALEVKNTKGVLCKNLMQADGVKPPRQDGKLG
ncbi:Uncharacterized protein SCF082_LOCUS26400 [Durusdinium trenchii]